MHYNHVQSHDSSEQTEVNYREPHCGKIQTRILPVQNAAIKPTCSVPETVATRISQLSHSELLDILQWNAATRGAILTIVQLLSCDRPTEVAPSHWSCPTVRDVTVTIAAARSGQPPYFIFMYFSAATNSIMVTLYSGSTSEQKLLRILRSRDLTKQLLRFLPQPRLPSAISHRKSGQRDLYFRQEYVPKITQHTAHINHHSTLVT